MELVDRVGVVNGEEVAVPSSAQSVGDGVQPARRTACARGRRCGSRRRCGPPGRATGRARASRPVVQEVEASDGWLAAAYGGRSRSKGDEALLPVRAIPQRFAVAQGLKAARAGRACSAPGRRDSSWPRRCCREPLPAVGEHRPRRVVRLERSVVHVEADDVHPHRGDALVVDRSVADAAGGRSSRPGCRTPPRAA